MLRVGVLACVGTFFVASSFAGMAPINQPHPMSATDPHRPGPPRARALPHSSPALLVHTATEAYDGHFDNGLVSPAPVRRWVSYAVGAGDAMPDKAVTDGDHCVNTCSVFYTDFARLNPANEPTNSFFHDSHFVECVSGTGSPAANDWVLHMTQPPACAPSTRTSPKPGIYNGNYGNLSGIGAAFLAYIQGTYSGVSPCCVNSNWNLHDYMFQDTTSVDLNHDTQCCSATYEFASNTTYDAALFAFEDSLVHVAGGPFTAGQAYLSFLNGFADNNIADDSGHIVCKVCTQDFGSTHVAGGVCEFCQQTGSLGSVQMQPLFVPYTVNTASVVIPGHQFINLAEFNSGESGVSGHQVGATFEDRYMLYATYMLYYQPSSAKSAILMEDFDKHATNSTFNGVFPEQALVVYGTPARPLVPYVTGSFGLGGCDPGQPGSGDSGGIAGYLIAGTCKLRTDGRWLGEYGQIYPSGSYPTTGLNNAPTSLGPIAFIINLTDVAKTVPCTWFTGLGYPNPTTTFIHEILISADGDVLNGGALNLSGAGFLCGLTTIPALSARFLGQ